MPIENTVPTQQSVRIVANLMPLTPLAASFSNIILIIFGFWNNMQRRMISDLVCILLLGKPVSAAKPWLLGVVVETVGRHRCDLDLFLAKDYPCRYVPCPVACKVIKLGVCSHMSNSLFAPILFSGFDFSCYFSVYILSC